MTDDMMIICKEDESRYDKNSNDAAFCIDEYTLSKPTTEFGAWFSERYSGNPSACVETIWVKLTPSDLIGIMHAVNNMKTHKNLDVKGFKRYIHNHNGKSVSVERW